MAAICFRVSTSHVLEFRFHHVSGQSEADSLKYIYLKRDNSRQQQYDKFNIRSNLLMSFNALIN